jgi:predicted transcriptional regulator of viral defense system
MATFATLQPVTSAPSGIKALAAAKLGSYFRPRDALGIGLTHRELQRLVELGEVERVVRGLYRLAGAEVTEDESLAMAAAAVPGGIVCLLSALRLHGVGTQAPHEVWMALDRAARRPARPPVRIQFVRFSGRMLTYGVTTRRLANVPVRVTSPARTVVDCFRYRRKLGIDVAIEALRDAVSRRVATRDEILRAAEVCRAGTILRPYLEALSS